MGAITSSAEISLGSGYSAGELLGVIQGTGANFTLPSAAIAILTVDGSGVPLTFLLPQEWDAGPPTEIGPSQGCGYFVQNNLATKHIAGPGAGAGFVINILAVGPGSDLTHGSIGETQLDAGGVGYAVGDTGLIVQGGNHSAKYIVTAVDGITGAVTEVNSPPAPDIINDPADGYAVGPATTLNAGPQPGVGVGFTLDILEISMCDVVQKTCLQ